GGAPTAQGPFRARAPWHALFGRDWGNLSGRAGQAVAGLTGTAIRAGRRHVDDRSGRAACVRDTAGPEEGGPVGTLSGRLVLPAHCRTGLPAAVTGSKGGCPS